jgi:hypothetical protein
MIHCLSPFFHLEAKCRPLKKKDKKWLTSIEIKIFRTDGYTRFDYKRNEEILEGLKIEPVDEKLRRYKSNWPRHVKRMNNNKMTKIMLNYRPNGRRRLGRPLKRILDEAETSLCRPNS